MLRVSHRVFYPSLLKAWMSGSPVVGKTVCSFFITFFARVQNSRFSTKTGLRGQGGNNTPPAPSEAILRSKLTIFSWGYRGIWRWFILSSRLVRSVSDIALRNGFVPNRYGQSRQSVPVQVRTSTQQLPTQSRQCLRMAFSGGNGFLLCFVMHHLSRI